MDRFKTVLTIASKQGNLGFGLVALLTAGGEQIFSSVAFRCPCNELNLLYGLVFLLVPALALLLLGYILSKKLWKLFTGLWRNKKRLCGWRNLAANCGAFFQISSTALVAPATWIAVALLNGSYYQCAMSGTNVSMFNQYVCRDAGSECAAQLHRSPCERHNDEVLLRLRSQSQILGWFVITLIMLSSLLIICVARCNSPISYQQLRFWRAYAQEESDLMDQYTGEHAKLLAERNLRSFFQQTVPESITTPSNGDWEKISSLYKFSTKDHYYSTLHRYVETAQDSDGGVRMYSLRSNQSTDNPAVLDFVDGGIAAV